MLIDEQISSLHLGAIIIMFNQDDEEIITIENFAKIQNTGIPIKNYITFEYISKKLLK